jgi:hypothetical protein
MIKSCPFQHGWNISGSKSSILAGLEYDQTRPFQHGWNVTLSKSSASFFLKCVMVKIVRFSMAGMCNDQNRPFQHGWNVLCSGHQRWFAEVVRRKLCEN